MNQLCPMCSCRFNSFDRVPRLLGSCGHRVCTPCLSTRLDELTASVGSNMLRCPFDSFEYFVTRHTSVNSFQIGFDDASKTVSYRSKSSNLAELSSKSGLRENFPFSQAFSNAPTFAVKEHAPLSQPLSFPLSQNSFQQSQQAGNALQFPAPSLAQFGRPTSGARTPELSPLQKPMNATFHSIYQNYDEKNVELSVEKTLNLNLNRNYLTPMPLIREYNSTERPQGLENQQFSTMKEPLQKIDLYNKSQNPKQISYNFQSETNSPVRTLEKRHENTAGNSPFNPSPEPKEHLGESHPLMPIDTQYINVYAMKTSPIYATTFDSSKQLNSGTKTIWNNYVPSGVKTLGNSQTFSQRNSYAGGCQTRATTHKEVFQEPFRSEKMSVNSGVSGADYQEDRSVHSAKFLNFKFVPKTGADTISRDSRNSFVTNQLLSYSKAKESDSYNASPIFGSKKQNQKTTTSIGNILAKVKNESKMTESFYDNVFQKKVRKDRFQSKANAHDVKESEKREPLSSSTDVATASQGLPSSAGLHRFEHEDDAISNRDLFNMRLNGRDRK